MTGNEIRRRFLEHFASREHKVLPSASLVPHGDPSTLFISAGMQPLKPYYLGLSDPPAPRLATCQKCLRTGDIDEVGKTDRHDTFFEMLGNFAPTGDYFKEEAIPLAWDLVTEVFAMPVDRLRVTIHPTDDEAHDIWIQQPGMTAVHVTRLEDNWWGLGAGPCGPDSEIWWDRGKEFGCGQDDCVPDHCDRFTEFWNLVFPQYDQRGPIEGTSGEAVRRGLADGSLVPLKRPAIDTGMGLERISYILQGKTNIFETDLLAPLVDAVRQNSDQRTTLSERIIADHIRAATFVIGDGVMPSNEGRGYVLRRLIRRAAIHAQRAGLRRPLTDLAVMVGAEMREPYPELQQQMPTIQRVLGEELVRFNRTVEQGLEQFEKVAAQHPKTILGADAFRLHDTYGFPLELTRELAAERGIEVDEQGFRASMEEQRARSRRGTPQGWTLAKDLPKSEFTGYRELTTETKVLALRKDDKPVEVAGEGDAVEVFLERTPFYAESGGQVGDTGTITTPSAPPLGHAPAAQSAAGDSRRERRAEGIVGRPGSHNFRCPSEPSHHEGRDRAYQSACHGESAGGPALSRESPTTERGGGTGSNAPVRREVRRHRACCVLRGLDVRALRRHARHEQRRHRHRDDRLRIQHRLGLEAPRHGGRRGRRRPRAP